MLGDRPRPDRRAAHHAMTTDTLLWSGLALVLGLAVAAGLRNYTRRRHNRTKGTDT